MGKNRNSNRYLPLLDAGLHGIFGCGIYGLLLSLSLILSCLMTSGLNKDFRCYV